MEISPANQLEWTRIQDNEAIGDADFRLMFVQISAD
jgi:hypothetical protein